LYGDRCLWGAVIGVEVLAMSVCPSTTYYCFVAHDLSHELMNICLMAEAVGIFLLV